MTAHGSSPRPSSGTLQPLPSGPAVSACTDTDHSLRHLGIVARQGKRRETSSARIDSVIVALSGPGQPEAILAVTPLSAPALILSQPIARHRASGGHRRSPHRTYRVAGCPYRSRQRVPLRRPRGMPEPPPSGPAVLADTNSHHSLRHPRIVGKQSMNSAARLAKRRSQSTVSMMCLLRTTAGGFGGLRLR